MLALPTDGTDMLPSYPAIPKRAATPPISPTPTPPPPLVSKPRRSFSIAVHPDHQKLFNLSADSEAWKKFLSEVANEHGEAMVKKYTGIVRRLKNRASARTSAERQKQLLNDKNAEIAQLKRDLKSMAFELEKERAQTSLLQQQLRDSQKCCAELKEAVLHGSQATSGIADIEAQLESLMESTTFGSDADADFNLDLDFSDEPSVAGDAAAAAASQESLI